MGIISSVVYLDRFGGVGLDNIFYMNAVSGIFFALYMLIEYLLKKGYYNQISRVISNDCEDIINRTPEARTHEERLFNELLMTMYNKQREKIEGLYEEKRENQEFITTWVHEVKTPLSVIRLLIENKEASDTDTLDSVEEEIDKIEAQVEQALYYSRTDDFSKDYFISEVELERVALEAVKRNARIFIGRKIKVSMEDLNHTILTHKKWLLYIINQILSNALKYTKAEGSVHISSQEDEREKRLVIEDNGIGIKPEDLGRVFDRGFTGQTGRQHSKSTGMGLYLSKRLAGKLGHDISIESEEGKYTRVIIHFPKSFDYTYILHK